jgi:hypothetical protein
MLGGQGGANSRDRVGLARELFLTTADMVPLLVLLVAVTGRNVESVKELPLAHTVLAGRAVQVRLPKRRRGPGAWEQDVTWEIGEPGRELHTPGGLYLLMGRLSERGRAFSGSGTIWSMWRNGFRAGIAGQVSEHHDPFAVALQQSFRVPGWAEAAGLLADAPAGDDGPGPALRVHFGQLKTSMDVRRTKQMGGHLPSAARSNTFPVLFRHYLRADPTTITWSQEVLGEAFADAEQAALRAHRAVAAQGLRVVRAFDAASIADAGVDEGVAERVARGDLDTAWAACVDPDHGPVGSRGCETSFLDCFHCPNALVTPAHLPRLVGLVQELSRRRAVMGQEQWWARYGPAWAAIRHDVLGRFTPAEVQAAGRDAPVDVMLDLVENPWSAP